MTEADAGSGRIPVVVVAGPTASGKSSLAMAVAAAMEGVVINADSMQVYRDLRILTARPDADDEALAPHRLFGVLDGDDVCSVGRWRAMAEAEIRRADAQGLLPVVVGGTGLYLNALMSGLAEIPVTPRAVVAWARDELERIGAAAFHKALAARDPAMGSRLRPSDRQRLVRAMCVFETTGRSLAEWQAEPVEPPADFDFHVVLMMPPRGVLYAACDTRFAAMLANGAMDEVRALRARGLDRDRPVMKAIGVAELGAVLDGSMTPDAAATAARQATRNYAKRQVTWFRHQIIANQTVITQLSKSMEVEIFAEIRRIRLTPHI